jgi:hypothetical protein
MKNDRSVRASHLFYMYICRAEFSVLTPPPGVSQPGSIWKPDVLHVGPFALVFYIDVRSFMCEYHGWLGILLMYETCIRRKLLAYEVWLIKKTRSFYLNPLSPRACTPKERFPPNLN